ncbi:hypothetical protein EDD86DRAFT_211227 [Gorgonomyces haynaldii]|nr:hypothetical protein EDD86DRAFT_211227 [Gorgonomyces haynaldii]
MTYTEKAVEISKAVVEKVDPYVPQFAKNTISYAANTASSAASYGVKTVTGTVDYGVKTVNATVDYTKATINSAQNYAQDKANSAYNFGKVVVKGATTTITSYTPGPVLNLVSSVAEGASALRADPVGTVKPYVPTFVIHAGEKTYEIVSHAQDATQKNIKATTGYIVTKVNGTVKYITDVPAIHSLIDKLNSLTAPVLTRFGVKKADGSVEAEETAQKEQ